MRSSRSFPTEALDVLTCELGELVVKVANPARGFGDGVIKIRQAFVYLTSPTSAE